MYEQIEKPKENKSRAVANSVGQKKSNGKQSFGFVDNRPEAIAQRKMQPLTNSSISQPIQKKENNTGLPDNLKSSIENLSGYSLSDVKVHYNSDRPAQLQAHAYAQGTDIYLASGQEKYLPHEAWHVVQQKQGRVKPTMQMKDKVNINDDVGLEKEADVMGIKALQRHDSTTNKPLERENETESNPIQRIWNKKEDTYLWDRLKDGVAWFSDEEGFMWFDIAEPTLIEVGNYEEYHSYEGQKKTWEQWNAISIIPVVDNSQTEKAFNGWEDNSGIDWSSLTDEQLADLQEKVLKYGIKPLITELLDHLPSEIRKPVFDRMDSSLGRLKLFKKTEFGRRSFHFGMIRSGNAATKSLATIEEEILAYWKSDVNKFDEDSYIFQMVDETYGNLQGQAMDGYQCINAGGAFYGQGLHLIIHETMHNLADPTFTTELRARELGDEGLNEYFARLATLTLKKHPISENELKSLIGSPKGGITPGNSESTRASKNRGVYGDLMQKKDFYWIDRDINEAQLVHLAKKYFLNI